MLRGGGLRKRYLYSLLLVMIPILLLSVILFTSNRDRSIQYINSSTSQNFTYAAENVSFILTRLESSAKTSFTIEHELTISPSGNVTVNNEHELIAELSALEQRLSPEVQVLLYIKGSNDIYSSSGKMIYGSFERAYLSDYEPSHSALFIKLQKLGAPSLIPLRSSQEKGIYGGLIYALPFPTTVSSNAVMFFVLHDSLISSEFENYLGPINGSLYLFDSVYNQLYSAGDASDGMPAISALRVHGAGAIPHTYNGRRLVVLRTANSSLGLHWIWAVPREQFYASMASSQRLIVLLIIILVAVTLILIVWIALFNYKPIRELVRHIMGDNASANKNELELIRSAYDQTADEAEALDARLNEMTPLAAQKFVRNLIFSQVRTQERFQDLCDRADIDFKYQWTSAFYLPYSSKVVQESHMEQALLAATRFTLPEAVLALGDLLQENALCVLVNFPAAPPCSNTVDITCAYAEQLYRHMKDYGAAPDVIGIGQAYQDPLKMHESFAEACAAVQLAPAGNECWHYVRCISEDADPEDFHGLSPLSLSLFSEGFHRGDKDTTLRALDDMLHQISNITHSLAFFRFYSSELLSVILKQTESLQLTIAKTRIQQMIAFSTIAEFTNSARELVSELCDEMQQRINDSDRQTKQNLLKYILANYKRSDLSIQTVADETGIRKTQITTLVKEETGLGFVQYISYLRLNEFKRLLVQSESTIRDIVNEIGYNDVPNFLRKFKSIEGVTPSLYRQMHSK